MIKRVLFNELIAHLEKKEISLIIGPRQAGKTTLMLLLQKYLQQRGEKTLFLSLDSEIDKQFFISQKSLIDRIVLEFGNERGYVFIDEIQRKENAGLFLKGIYDMNLPYKFIVSGSGSLELKEKIHESLVGRKRVFELTTLTFEEFVNYKTDYRYCDNLEKFLALDEVSLFSYLEEYLRFGGYPKVVLEKTLTEKLKTINEIYTSYLEKDIAYLGIKKTEAFSDLIKLIASQSGQLTNINNLSKLLGISARTIKDYLWYAEKTFILSKISPYSKRLAKEIVKSPIYYFNDLGLRNFALGRFNQNLPTDMSFLFQNLIYLQLKKITRDFGYSVKFWRTKDGSEVDFVIDKNQTAIPIEVKYSRLKKAEVSKSMMNFINKYNPQKGFIINLGFKDEVFYKKTLIMFRPFFSNLSFD